MLSVPSTPANFGMLSQPYSSPVPTEPSGSANCLPDHPRNHCYALEAAKNADLLQGIFVFIVV